MWYCTKLASIGMIIFLKAENLTTFSNYWQLLSQRASGENGNHDDWDLLSTLMISMKLMILIMTIVVG